MIDLFLKFDISFFSVLLLLLILVTMERRRDTMSYSSRLFKRLIYVNIYMLILEIASWQFDGLPGTFNWYANYISNMLFAWSTPIITCVWASYMDYRMFGSANRLKRRWNYLHPIIANTILIAANFFRPIIFSVSPDNVYSREPFMWLIVIINGIALAYMCYLAYTNRSKIQKKVIYVILMFVCLPAITAGVQVMLYGVFIMWPMMAVTLVVTYIYLETTSTANDYLTGLFSRIRLDEYVDLMINTNQRFGVIMIDLNDFKKINDTYGHHKGDEALITFANALMKVFHEEKMVGRFAGDEFLIITDVLTDDKLEIYRKQLSQILEQSKNASSMEYDLDFSMGYISTRDFVIPSYAALVNGADKLMYKDKQKRKLEKNFVLK